jgi:hypothetical protein
LATFRAVTGAWDTGLREPMAYPLLSGFAPDALTRAGVVVRRATTR